VNPVPTANLVSVIVPAYNVEQYLAEALDSIVAQTWRDFEVVIVNDGSTDGTQAIAERYRALHGDRIVLVSQPNRGLAAARNTAMAAARGSVFALLDSDDAWAPGFLEAQMRILQAHPEIAIVTGNGINRGGGEDGLPVRPADDRRPAPTLLDILRDETAVFIMAVFRREVVEAIGGFDERFRTNEDYDFWIRAAQAGFRFARNSTPLGYYRRHANSLSASDVRMLTGILRVYHKALPLCPPGSPEREIVERQIARFDVERLAAEARAALDRGDTGEAIGVLNQLLDRQRSVPMTLFTALLRLAPRAGLAAYRLRRRMQHSTRAAAFGPAAAPSAS
jgi:hypothetical protein